MIEAAVSSKEIGLQGKGREGAGWSGTWLLGVGRFPAETLWALFGWQEAARPLVVAAAIHRAEQWKRYRTGEYSVPAVA